MLNPDSDIAKLELAELYGNVDHYAKAIAVIDKFQEPSPFWVNAQMRKALYLNSTEKGRRGIRPAGGPAGEATGQLAALADRRRNRERAARITKARIPYYDRAIKLLGTPEKKDWQLFYSRGIAL